MEQSRRLRRVLAGCALLAAAGLAYGLWVDRTGLALPCPFRAVTGLQCPGCGVTRLCVALLRGDLAAAWQANPVLLLLLPALAALLLRTAVRYVREGRTAGPRWEGAVTWAMIAVLAVWGVVRNLI